MPVPASDLTSVETGGPTGSDAKHPSSSQDEYIYVPDDFKVKEGARLTEHLRVGKALGVGLQVIAHGLYKLRTSVLTVDWLCREAYSCFKTMMARLIQIKCSKQFSSLVLEAFSA